MIKKYIPAAFMTDNLRTAEGKRKESYNSTLNDCTCFQQDLLYLYFLMTRLILVNGLCII